MFNELNLLSLTRHRLDHAAARQTLVARNIANADTPGYVAVDLKEPDFAARAAKVSSVPSLPMAATHISHQLGTPDAARMQAFSRETDMTTTPSGNGVELDIEAGKMARISSAHRFATAIYGKYVALFRTAMGAGGA